MDDSLSKIDAPGVWNPVGFHVIDARKGAKFCSAHHLSHIMDPLLAALQRGQGHPFRKFVIYE
jgi:hypothetical protein